MRFTELNPRWEPFDQKNLEGGTRKCARIVFDCPHCKGKLTFGSSYPPPPYDPDRWGCRLTLVSNVESFETITLRGPLDYSLPEIDRAKFPYNTHHGKWNLVNGELIPTEDRWVFVRYDKNYPNPGFHLVREGEKDPFEDPERKATAR